ncbi:nuclear transport factor 2 family protein [Actinoplanes palleronii]
MGREVRQEQPVPVDLTVIARNGDDGWRIAHHHVSPR